MVRPKTLAKSVKRDFENSTLIPNEMNYVLQEPDRDSPIDLPFISIETVSRIKLNRHNTDFVGNKTDENGNEVAEVFASDYDIDFQIDFYSAEGSTHDAHEIGQVAQDQVLYEHSMYGPQKPFYDEKGDLIEEVWRFDIDDSSVEDDLTMSPNLRRWRVDVSFSAYHRFEKDVEYIEEITYEQKVL